MVINQSILATARAIAADPFKFIHQKGEEEQARGKRDAKRSEDGGKAASELNGPCQAYKG